MDSIKVFFFFSPKLSHPLTHSHTGEDVISNWPLAPLPPEPPCRQTQAAAAASLLSLPFVAGELCVSVWVCVCSGGEKSLGDIKHGRWGVVRINMVPSTKDALQTVGTVHMLGSSVLITVQGAGEGGQQEGE